MTTSKYRYTCLLAAVLANGSAWAEELPDHNTMLMDHGGGHLMDMGGGMVMGNNTDTLPGSCDRISEEREITVRAGHKYSEKFPGRMYAFDQQEWRFKPCTKLTVNFINEDKVRHQWMMHGLPKYLYKKGMFHLEVTGPGKISGTLILPAEDRTYLVHCDLAQHMEKGMKAQLIVGKGGTPLPSVPGISALAIPDSYVQDTAVVPEAGVLPPEEPEPGARSAQNLPSAANTGWISGITVIGLAAGVLLAPLLAKRYKDKSTGEIIADVFGLLKSVVDSLVKSTCKLIQLLSRKKSSES